MDADAPAHHYRPTNPGRLPRAQTDRTAWSAAPTSAGTGRVIQTGSAGAEIPLGARIIAVCDSYDAMTSDRSYRRAMSEEVALAELSAGAGSQFDPEVVAAFLRVRTQALMTAAPRTHSARPALTGLRHRRNRCSGPSQAAGSTSRHASR